MPMPASPQGSDADPQTGVSSLVTTLRDMLTPDTPRQMGYYWLGAGICLGVLAIAVIALVADLSVGGLLAGVAVLLEFGIFGVIFLFGGRDID